MERTQNDVLVTQRVHGISSVLNFEAAFCLFFSGYKHFTFLGTILSSSSALAVLMNDAMSPSFAQLLGPVA